MRHITSYNKYIMETDQSLDKTFMTDVKSFVSDMKHELSHHEETHAKKSIEKQLETFEADMEKLMTGQLTYAEIRMLYG